MEHLRFHFLSFLLVFVVEKKFDGPNSVVFSNGVSRWISWDREKKLALCTCTHDSRYLFNFIDIYVSIKFAFNLLQSTVHHEKFQYWICFCCTQNNTLIALVPLQRLSFVHCFVVDLVSFSLRAVSDFHNHNFSTFFATSIGNWSRSFFFHAHSSSVHSQSNTQCCWMKCSRMRASEWSSACVFMLCACGQWALIQLAISIGEIAHIFDDFCTFVWVFFYVCFARLSIFKMFAHAHSSSSVVYGSTFNEKVNDGPVALNVTRLTFSAFLSAAPLSFFATAVAAADAAVVIRWIKQQMNFEWSQQTSIRNSWRMR